MDSLEGVGHSRKMEAKKPEELFDTKFQALQRARLAAQGVRPALYLKAEALLKERMNGLKEPPPDLRLSCLELQSENDLPGALSNIRASLKPGGLFLGVLTGNESLRELRLSLLEAELALKGGASPRVAPMPDLPTLSRLMQEMGFVSPVADSERFTLIYPDLFALMRDLRALGLTNSLAARTRAFTPRTLFTKTAEIYATRFPAPSGTGLTASVHLIFLHGWKSLPLS